MSGEKSSQVVNGSWQDPRRTREGEAAFGIQCRCFHYRIEFEFDSKGPKHGEFCLEFMDMGDCRSTVLEVGRVWFVDRLKLGVSGVSRYAITGRCN